MYLKNGNPWNRTGYVLPPNVRREVPGGTVNITKGRKRGTIANFITRGSLRGSSLAKSTLAGNSIAGSSLSGSSLGNDDDEGYREGLGFLTFLVPALIYSAAKKKSIKNTADVVIGTSFGVPGLIATKTGRSIIKKASSLICDASGNQFVKAGVGAGAAAYGGPTAGAAAMQTTDTVKTLCGNGTYAPPLAPPPPSSEFPFIPIIIGGGILAVIMFAKRGS